MKTLNHDLQSVISTMSMEDIIQTKIYLECLENAALLDIDISEEDIYHGRHSDWKSSVYGILNKENNIFTVLAKIPDKQHRKGYILESKYNAGRFIGDKFFFHQPEDLTLFLTVKTN